MWISWHLSTIRVVFIEAEIQELVHLVLTIMLPRYVNSRCDFGPWGSVLIGTVPSLQDLFRVEGGERL